MILLAMFQRAGPLLRPVTLGADGAHTPALRLRGERRGGRLAAFGPGVAVLLGALGLLLALQHVVQGAVEHGELRRLAVARHADATWRCRALRGSEPRTDCLSELGQAP